MGKKQPQRSRTPTEVVGVPRPSTFTAETGTLFFVVCLLCVLDFQIVVPEKRRRYLMAACRDCFDMERATTP